MWPGRRQVLREAGGADPRQGVLDAAQGQLHDALPERALVALAQRLAQFGQQLPSRVPVSAQLPGQLQRGEPVLGLGAEVEGQEPRGRGSWVGRRGSRR